MQFNTKNERLNDKIKDTFSKKWQKRFFNLAKEVSTWSKDPSHKVGAVIVNDSKQVLSLGYNGLPRGVLDLERRLNNRELKLSLIEHAERNAIFNAHTDIRGTSIFIYGLPPCNECSKAIIQSGIKHVYYTSKLDKNSKWYNSFKISKMMFTEAGIKLHFMDLENEAI